MGPVPHRCSRCGNPCHLPTQELSTESYLHQVSHFLFNVIISNKFNLELDVDDLIFFNVQLFSAESPTHEWEDTGFFNLDGVMVAAEDITEPYT